jgi:hypothetical protein
MYKKYFLYPILLFLLLSYENIAISQTVINLEKIKPVPPASFIHSDVGNPAIAGALKISADAVEITAGGADIWGVKDEFSFGYIERTGDFDIITRIESLSAAHLRYNGP